MLSVKDAVQAAEQWVRELYPKRELRHLRLEEVELSADDRFWFITLGWLEPAVREHPLASVLNREVNVLPRVYKTVKVDAESGAVVSMKIREVA